MNTAYDMVTGGAVYQSDNPSSPMKRARLTVICLLLLLPASPPSWAESAVRGPSWPTPNWSAPNWTAPNWTKHEALQAAGEIDLVPELRPLFERARAGEDADLRRRLEAVAANEKWPQPARERLLHAFALGLGELPPDSAGPESLAYLLDYRPRTLVPHEDHASAGVPLFNIPAAATGSMNLWRRQIAYDSSREMLAGSAETWVTAWLAADPASRRGFLDALDLAPEARLREVVALALQDLSQRPELTLVAARSAAILPDPDLLGDALVAGDGPELAAALRLAAAALDESERTGLLRRLVAQAPARNGSLAIAELAPGLLHDPAVAGLLFDLLGDPALGATAALALASSRQPAVRERLADLAEHGDDTSARRAAAALAVAPRTDRGDPR